MAVVVVAFNHVANQKLPWEYPSRRGWFRRSHAFTLALLCGLIRRKINSSGDYARQASHRPIVINLRDSEHQTRRRDRRSCRRQDQLRLGRRTRRKRRRNNPD